MKILHTSDWHIGKRLHGKDRLEEQKEALKEIAKICEEQSIDIVCVAGDIFDAYTPSSEAEDVFYESILKISGKNERIVIIIAGNHDDPVRLSAAEALAEKHGIVIVKGMDYKAKLSAGTNVKIIKSVNGGIIAENKNGEKCAIAFLPYPSDSRFNEIIKQEETYSSKVKRWLSSGTSLFTKDSFNVILSHLFTAGAAVSGDERSIELGGAKIVGISAFDEKADCILLGHIHKRQNLSKARNIEYCGAIMQNTFDEDGQKGVVVLTLQNNKLVNKEFVPLITPKKLVKIKAESVAGAVEQLENLKNCFIELTLKLNEPLTYSDNKMLRTSYPEIVTIILELNKEKENSISSVKHLNRTELFIAFWKNKFGKAPDNDVLELYNLLIEGGLGNETVFFND